MKEKRKRIFPIFCAVIVLFGILRLIDPPGHKAAKPSIDIEGLEEIRESTGIRIGKNEYKYWCSGEAIFNDGKEYGNVGIPQDALSGEIVAYAKNDDRIIYYARLGGLDENEWLISFEDRGSAKISKKNVLSIYKNRYAYPEPDWLVQLRELELKNKPQHPASDSDIPYYEPEIPEDMVISEIEGLEIRVLPPTVSSTRLCLGLTNRSEQTYTYGAWFRIQRLEDGSWLDIYPLANWMQDDWAMDVFPGMSTVKDCRWGWYYGELPPGDYRAILRLNAYYTATPFTIPDGEYDPQSPERDLLGLLGELYAVRSPFAAAQRAEYIDLPVEGYLVEYMDLNSLMDTEIELEPYLGELYSENIRYSRGHDKLGSLYHVVGEESWEYLILKEENGALRLLKYSLVLDEKFLKPKEAELSRETWPELDLSNMESEDYIALEERLRGFSYR